VYSFAISTSDLFSLDNRIKSNIVLSINSNNFGAIGLSSAIGIRGLSTTSSSKNFFDTSKNALLNIYLSS
jgi:hypothetical protein